MSKAEVVVQKKTKHSLANKLYVITKGKSQSGRLFPKQDPMFVMSPKYTNHIANQITNHSGMGLISMTTVIVNIFRKL